MKIRVGDIVGYLGRDYVVDGMLAFVVNGKGSRLARSVDGDTILWVELIEDEADDRVLVLREVSDLDISTPPPQSILYRGAIYLPRLAGLATVEIAGKVPDRQPGACRLWRYRAAGDSYIEIQDWSGRVVTLAGESVHKAMIEVFARR